MLQHVHVVLKEN